MNSQEPLAHSAKKDRGIPAQAYAKHIAGVAKRAQKNISAMLEYFSGEALPLIGNLHCAAYLHDLGKLDPANQEALRCGNKRSLPINHVDAGTTMLLDQAKNKEAALLVYGHHIGLCSIPQEASRRELFFRDEEIYKHTDAQLAKYVAEHQQWCGTTAGLSAVAKTGWNALTRRLLFSCLVDADHGDSAENDGKASHLHKIEPRWNERLSRLDAYVDNLAKGDADKSRILQRKEVYCACKNSDVKPSIYACDSPVGTGKTTAVMAHLLRTAQKKNLRHVFVILPYTNIIKQSVDVYRKALVLPGENPEEIVAELHHQADFSSEDLRQYSALWTVPIIVTTAVQFFETLAGNHPGQLRKLHELPGSAVFVDEAHAAIPSFMWPQAW